MSGFLRRLAPGFPIGGATVGILHFIERLELSFFSGPVATQIIPPRSPVVLVLRRLTALVTTLLLFQADWQGSGAACLVGHASSHGGSNAVPAMAAVAQSGVQTAAGMTHDGMVMTPAHRARNEARAIPGASPSTESTESVPSHCPDSGIPSGCAAAMACSAVAMSIATAPSLATDAWQAGGEMSESDTRPHSRADAPDVPPPRA